MYKYLKRKAAPLVSLTPYGHVLPWREWLTIVAWRLTRGAALLAVPMAALAALAGAMVYMPWILLAGGFVMGVVWLVYWLGSDTW